MVPATLVTMLRSSPMKALTSEDLPALGRPTIAIRGASRVSSTYSPSGRFFVMASRRSPVPLPLTAEIGIGSPRPKL